MTVPSHPFQMFLSNLLTGMQIVAMSALAIIDVAGVMNVADFMIRPDGSQQDPNHMLPQEKILVSMIAFPFLTVVLAFIFAPRKNAALIAAATHGLYILHQAIFYDTWQALFHPDASVSMEFFMVAKFVWMNVSLVIWYLESAKEAQNSKSKSS